MSTEGTLVELTVRSSRVRKDEVARRSRDQHPQRINVTRQPEHAKESYSSSGTSTTQNKNLTFLYVSTNGFSPLRNLVRLKSAYVSMNS